MAPRTLKAERLGERQKGQRVNRISNPSHTTTCPQPQGHTQMDLQLGVLLPLEPKQPSVQRTLTGVLQAIVFADLEK